MAAMSAIPSPARRRASLVGSPTPQSPHSQLPRPQSASGRYRSYGPPPSDPIPSLPSSSNRSSSPTAEDSADKGQVRVGEFRSENPRVATTCHGPNGGCTARRPQQRRRQARRRSRRQHGPTPPYSGGSIHWRVRVASRTASSPLSLPLQQECLPNFTNFNQYSVFAHLSPRTQISRLAIGPCWSTRRRRPKSE